MIDMGHMQVSSSTQEASMPMIIVRYVTPTAQADLQPKIASLASKLAAEHLKKDPKVTAVLVEAADPKAWFVAGSNPTEQNLGAYWIDVKITAGTNVKGDTTAFIKAAHAGIRNLLGAVHEESYVLVHAVDGHSYGFGGRTQEGRWSAANPG
jgi:4-oxalocrotonate tautomerase